MYDGTTGIGNGDVTINATTFALRDGAAGAGDGKYYTGEDVKTKLKTAGLFTSKDVASGLQNVTTEVELDGTGKGNYTLNAYQLQGTITKKDLVVNAGGITVSKVYDGTTSIANGNVTIGAAALTGGSTSATDGQYIGTENVTLEVALGGAFTSKDVSAGSQGVSTTVQLVAGNAVNGNYELRAQPSLTGTILAKGLNVEVGEVAVSKVYAGVS